MTFMINSYFFLNLHRAWEKNRQIRGDICNCDSIIKIIIIACNECMRIERTTCESINTSSTSSFNSFYREKDKGYEKFSIKNSSRKLYVRNRCLVVRQILVLVEEHWLALVVVVVAVVVVAEEEYWSVK